MFREAIDKFHKAIEYGGCSYNLACLHAIRNEKGESLKYLDRSLSGREITVEFVEQDKDWRGLSEDPDFKQLIAKYNDMDVR